ncbi:MAG: hypothetical protein JW884_02565 [Deltaproteobacteria bacterium]|nr:hypothetical protein [Deltaproteobacteria bacterium]
MMRKMAVLSVFCCVIVALIAGCGAMEKMVEPTAKTDEGAALDLPPYDGPRARAAVADFEWKVGGGSSSTTISGFGASPITIKSSHNEGYAQGLRDMLTTTMVQSKRYRVLERQNLSSLQQEMALTGQGYTDKSGATKGKIKGADLLIMGAITGWDPGSSGGGGGIGGGLLGTATAVMGAVGGAFKKSSMAMDIRIVDTNTSEVLAATRVEGVAKDVNLGALAGIAGGSGGMGGGLSGFAKTPMEKAIRTCMYNAVKFIAENTPKQYMKY